MTYLYRLYNLTLEVPFPCPILTPAPAAAVPDVRVLEGDVPGFLEQPQVEGPTWQAAPGQFIFRGGLQSGRFLVEGGERITLYRNPTARDAKLCAHLLASVMAALLRQRGLLVLHANVALTPEGAVALTGTSGAGKSTTQAALLERGCRMLTDDITVLDTDREGRIIALPGVPKMNLCADAATKLGHDVANLPRNPLRGAKVLVPVAPEDTLAEQLPLRAIYHLIAPAGDRMAVTRLEGAGKFAALQECIYGPLFPEEHHGLFSLVSEVVRQVELVQITRPVDRWSLDEVVEAILHG